MSDEDSKPARSSLDKALDDAIAEALRSLTEDMWARERRILGSLGASFLIEETVESDNAIVPAESEDIGS